ncbi:MAG TPA: molecular chaperone DnaK, partial [Clostridiales bacterium]|nr:molecular chaperone DnaK [Clostridiales bacterium]
EVSFDIDANGIVNVTAKDKGTGKEQHITIQSTTHMNKSDIEKAVRDAEMHAEEDKKLKEAAEAKNNAESLIFQSEKTLTEAGSKISDSEKKPVQDAVAKLKETLKTGTVDQIKADTEELQKAIYEVSAILYKQQGGPNPGEGGDAGKTPNDDGVYNADFTDKSDV